MARSAGFRLLLALVAALLGAPPLSAQGSASLLSAIERLQLGDEAGAARALEAAATAGNAFALSLRGVLAGEGPGAALAPPRTAEERLARAEIALAGRHPAEALDVLAPLLPSSTGSSPPEPIARAVLRAAGRASLLAGKYEDAERWLTAPAPGEAATSLALARARYRQGNAAGADQALAPFVAALLATGSATPPIPPAVAAQILLEHGRIANAAGQAADAVTALARAVELEPANGPAWQALAQARLREGDRAGGEAALARSRELAKASQPEAVDVDQLRAQAAAAEAAKAEGERIVAQARAIARDGKAEDALAYLDREIAAKPGLLEPRLLLISLLLSAKRLPQAATAADAAVSAFPREPDATYHRAVVALIASDLPAAERNLEKTLELAPRHVPALNNLAVIRLQRGDLAGGRALLDRVLAIDPANAQAKENLAKLPQAKP